VAKGRCARGGCSAIVRKGDLQCRGQCAITGRNNSNPAELFSGAAPENDRVPARRAKSPPTFWHSLLPSRTGSSHRFRKRRLVILTEPAEIELWLTASWEKAKRLKRPLPDNKMVMLEDAV
jgi:hypothetical protein